MLKFFTPTAITVAVAAMVIACADSTSSTTTPPASAPSQSPATSPLQATATTPSSTSCGSSTPIVAPSPTDAVVNADGDGMPDRLTVFAPPPDPTGSGDGFQLQLVLDDRAAFNIEASAGAVPKVAPIGGYDVDGDGRDELFAVTGNGAYTTWIDIFRFDPVACKLVRITNPDPHWSPPLFAVGASVGNGAGLQCADHTLVSTTFSRISDDPLEYGGKRTTYRLNATQIELVTEADVQFDSSAAQTAAMFTCGPLRLTAVPLSPAR